MSFPAQEVLITEHLTFAPLSLVDDIINTANALLYKSVNAMEQLFSNLPPASIPDEEVETGIHKFETLLENAVDRNFDAMELFVLRNIVSIPEDLLSHTQLKHHAGLDFGSHDSIEADMAKAQRTLIASQEVAAMLSRARSENERTLTSLERHAESLQFLEDLARKHDMGSMRDLSGFLKEQVTTLQSLLEETMQLSSSVDVTLERSERSAYIEKVLHETVPEGTWDKDLAAMQSIGTVENLQNAANLLKAHENT